MRNLPGKVKNNHRNAPEKSSGAFMLKDIETQQMCLL